jgi:DNA (cytosine-5)-methyltransferase 1
MLRAIREIQPRWVVGENVRGIISWNGGLVFHEVQTDLEAEGYKVLPFLLPACAVNAPHRRDRVWFVAFNANSRAITGNRTEQKVFKSNESTNSIGIRKKITANTCSEYSALPVQQRRQNKTENFNFNRENESRNVTYSEFEGLQRGKIDRKQSQYFQHERLSEAPIIADANKFNGNIPGFRAGEISQQQAPGIQQNNASDTTIFGQQRGRNSGKLREQREVRNERLKNVGGFSREDWQDFPTQSPVCSGNDGISTDLLRQRIREDSMGCLSEKEIDKIFSKADTEFRTGSLMAYGNSMVPQEVFQIFKAIEQYEKL